MNAFERPSLAAAVPELDTCSASVANPANEYAAATVETSFIVTKSPDEKIWFPPIDPGQVPSAAINPAAEFVPDPKPGSPPSEYRYTCCPPTQV